MSQIQDKLTDHEYDGIQEYDNPMPRWWLGMFYGTIAFSLVYVAYFHGGPGLSAKEEYDQEMTAYAEWEAQQALSAGEVTNETIGKVMANEASVLEGQGIFQTNCVQCHGPQGAGNIGPNLTDEYWLHGGNPIEIYTTVSEGVQGKGMQSWKRQLKPDELVKVTAFVATLRGTNIEGKAPEGAKFDINAQEPAGKEAAPGAVQ